MLKLKPSLTIVAQLYLQKKIFFAFRHVPLHNHAISNVFTQMFLACRAMFSSVQIVHPPLLGGNKNLSADTNYLPLNLGFIKNKFK